MGWKGKYAGGLLGMIVGGPIGGLVGAALGDAKQEADRAAEQRRCQAIRDGRDQPLLPGCVSMQERKLSSAVGLQSPEGGFTVLFEKETRVPCKRTLTVNTAKDHQLLLDVQVYQGDSLTAEQNTEVAVFRIAGWEPRPKGHAVEATFEITKQGRVAVQAREAGKKRALEVVQGLQ